jgi:hypothetical protein
MECDQLSKMLIVTLTSAVLAFALYATLKPVNHLLAQVAMIFSLGDSFLGMVLRTCSFVRVHLYTSVKDLRGGAIAAETLSDLMRRIAGTAENIGGISFGIGSLLFFYLFFKSDYIPRFLSGLGLAASVIWICLYWATLVYPERHSLFQYVSFPPDGSGRYHNRLISYAVLGEGAGLSAFVDIRSRAATICSPTTRSIARFMTASQVCRMLPGMTSR